MVKQEKTERLDGESTIAAQVIMFKGRIYDFFLFRSDFFIKQNIFQHVLLLYHHQAVTCALTAAAILHHIEWRKSWKERGVKEFFRLPEAC